MCICIIFWLEIVGIQVMQRKHWGSWVQSSKMSAHSQTPVMLARVLIGLHDVLDRMMIAEFKEDEVQTKTLKVKKHTSEDSGYSGQLCFSPLLWWLLSSLLQCLYGVCSVEPEADMWKQSLTLTKSVPFVKGWWTIQNKHRRTLRQN